MKTKQILFIFTMLSLPLMAQNPLLDSMPYVHVNQDSLVLQLLNEQIYGVQHTDTLVDGFRVQIYSSNVQQTGKAEALALEKRLASQLTVPIYIDYISPYWKVRLGDFLTIEEAQEYKNELVKQFPDLQATSYVIGDKIRVKQ